MIISSASTNYLREAILKILFKNTSFSATGPLWLGLFLNDPRNYYPAPEVSAAGYTRMQIPFTVSGSTATNSSVVQFPIASTMWGTITHVGLLTAATNGILYFYGKLTNVKTIYPQGSFFLNVGELSISLESGYSTFLAGSLLNHITNNTAYTPPNVYCALYTTLPDKNDSGGTEVNASNYNRIRIYSSDWSEIVTPTSVDNSVQTRTINNVNPIQFIQDSQYSWGTIRGICLRDAANSGHQLLRGSFPYSSQVLSGDSYNITSGNLIVGIG